MSSTIVSVQGRQILDSRGNPTVEAEVELRCGVRVRAQAPSGASTGVHEAVELRDGNEALFNGKSVFQAVNHINNEIAAAIINTDALCQQEIDATLIHLDGTSNKSALGANAILPVSIAVAGAAAEYLETPLFRYLGGCCQCRMPVPFMNIINGGRHANNNLSIQEYMIIPFGFSSFSDALRAGVETYHTLQNMLKENNKSVAVGDEGGFAPPWDNNTQPFDAISHAIERAGYDVGTQIGIGIDVAASEFYDSETKRYSIGTEQLSSDSMVDLLDHWTRRWSIISIEDGCAEDDWNGWDLLTRRLGKKVQLVGDDLFATNINRVKKGVEKQIANSVLIKPNQIGTVSETIKTAEYAQNHGLKTIVSHRSGETEDTFIADLAVALNTGQIKTGAPTRSDRNAKYNQLLRIEQRLGKFAQFNYE